MNKVVATGESKRHNQPPFLLLTLRRQISTNPPSAKWEATTCSTQRVAFDNTFRETMTARTARDRYYSFPLISEEPNNTTDVRVGIPSYPFWFMKGRRNGRQSGCWFFSDSKLGLRATAPNYRDSI